MLKKRPVIVAKREIDMREKNVIYQLNKLGYTRTENHIESIPGKTLRKENCQAKMLNHTIMEHIRFVEWTLQRQALQALFSGTANLSTVISTRLILNIVNSMDAPLSQIYRLCHRLMPAAL